MTIWNTRGSSKNRSILSIVGYAPVTPSDPGPTTSQKASAVYVQGGWVEAQEFNLAPQSDNDSFPADSAIIKWHKLFHEGMLKAGCEMRCASEKLKEEMEKAGFVNVQSVDLMVPMSPWSEDPKLKDAGSFVMTSMMEDISVMSLAVFTRLLGWERIELELFLAEVRKEWKDKSIHGYWPL